ncbi:GerMN domain-containing protein [Marinicrinis sediminis]|uniref:GerMN domain-containing protein n=1 Tax=Marinicrinis sediminis TaxID=1652465 RepID=A0ABW5RHF0_9BACL
MNRSKQLAVVVAITAVIVTGCGQNNNNLNHTAVNNLPSNNSSSNEGSKGQNEPSVPPEEQAPTEEQIEETNEIQKQITFFYTDTNLMNMYRVDGEITAESKEELPLKALEAWIAGPEQEELVSLLPSTVEVLDVSIKEDVAYVNFSENLLETNVGSGGELFLIDQIALLMNQFGASSTQILIEGNMRESLMGHVSTNQPHPAPNPEDFEWLPVEDDPSMSVEPTDPDAAPAT